MENAVYRLVGYIMPKTSWGIKEDENEFERIASIDEKEHEQYGICFVRLCTVRGNPQKWMVSVDNIAVPVGEQLADWETYKMNLTKALDLPVMHKEDFE